MEDDGTPILKTIDGEDIEIGDVFYLKGQPGHKIDTSKTPCDHHEGWRINVEAGVAYIVPYYHKDSDLRLVTLMSYRIDRLFSSQRKAIEDARSKWVTKTYEAQEQVNRYNHMLIQLKYEDEAKDDYFDE